MGWLWPRMRGEREMAARAGRVLFWLGAIAAALFAVLAVAGVFIADSSGALPMFFICATIAGAFYLAGRGACYLLAGE